MDDGTAGPKSCSICGDPVRSDNTFGICTKRSRPDCFKAYKREVHRRKTGQAGTVPEPKQCEVCGSPISANNQLGICSGKNATACKSARNKKRKRLGRGLPPGEREPCRVCGGNLRIDNIVGICRRTPECRRELKATRRREASEARAEAAKGQPPKPPAPRPRRVPPIPVGTVFGKLVTLEENAPGMRAKVLCRCECGNEPRILVGNLKRGGSRSCGCLKREKGVRPRSPDGIYLRAGSVSGRLTTLEDAPWSYTEVSVRCECGNVTEKNAQRIKFGNVNSCGCLFLEAVTTHGLSGHPLYNIWREIVGRGSNAAHRDYENYGQIGRTTCAGWIGMPDGFLSFVADMGPRPGPEYSTDRLDNEGGYWCGHCAECIRLGYPANAAWGTKEQQAANRSSALDEIHKSRASAARLEEAERLLAGPRRKRTERPVVQEMLF